MNLKEAKATVKNHAKQLQELFGLQHWDIEFNFNPRKTKILADVDTTQEYLEARINIYYIGIESEDELLDTLIHEYAHIIISPLADQSSSCLKRHLPKLNRKKIHKIEFDNLLLANEQVTTAIERLVKLLLSKAK
jgi:hypothetical protein